MVFKNISDSNTILDSEKSISEPTSSIGEGALRTLVPSQFSEVDTLLTKGVDSGVFPGVVLIVGSQGKLLFAQSTGSKGNYGGASRANSLAMDLDTIFDVASLTSLVVTTTIMMLLTEKGKLQLDERISRYIQGFGVYGKSEITIRHLFEHTSGLPQWIPFFEELTKLNSASRAGLLASRAAKEWVYNAIRSLNVKHQAGVRYQYSEIGFIILGQMIEFLTGQSLDHAAQRMVFRPLGMRSSSFVDLALMKRRGFMPILDLIAPTEECSWRERMLCGEVHDDNAWAMGGIAGHSGLFTSGSDLTCFAQSLIADLFNCGRNFKSSTIARFWGLEIGESSITTSENLPLGWQRPNSENGMMDIGFSEFSVGLNGFTGCSLWIDPARALSVVLMSNRINPSRSNKKLLNFRPLLHKAVIKALDGSN